MMVKICGITNRDDALAAIDAGATALGFNFYPKSPRYVTPEQAAEIGRGITGIKVGIFVDDPDVDHIAHTSGIDIAQLHGSEGPDVCPQIPMWKAFRVNGDWNPSVLDPFSRAEAFLLDGPLPGTGEGFDWTRATNLKVRIILAGGLDGDNVERAILAVRPWGVDACSRLEKAPGIKDHKKVLRFVRAALAVQL